MKSVLKWLFRVAVVLVLLALGMALTVVLAAPGIVQGRLVAALEGMGLAGSTARVDAVWLNHALVTDLNLGRDERLTVDTIEVTYDTAGLRSGRVKAVRLSGAMLRLAYRDGRIDFGDLTSLQLGEPTSDAPGPLPFDTIELRSSAVMMTLDDRVYRIPISGELTRTADRAVSFDFDAEVLEHRVKLSGALKLTDDGFEATALRMEVPMTDLRLPGGELVLGGLVAEIHLAAAMDEAGLTLELQSPTKIAMRSVRGLPDAVRFIPTPTTGAWVTLSPAESSITAQRDAASGAWSLPQSAVRAEVTATEIVTGGARLNLAPVTLNATLQATIAEQIDASLQLAAKDAVHLAGPAEITIGRAGLTAAMTQSPQEPLTIDMALALSGGSLVQREQKIAVTGVAVDASWRRRADDWGTDQPDQAKTGAATGRFKVERIRYGGDEFPPLAGELAWASDALHLSAQWAMIEQAIVNLGVTAGAEGVVVKADMPRTTIVDYDALGRRFSALRDYEIDGTFALDAQLAYRFGRLDPRIRLDMADASIRSNELDLAATGVDGTVTIDSLAPLTTDGGQRLSIRKFRSGKLLLTDGQLAFRLQRDGSVFVERTQWSLDGKGVLTVHAFTYNPDKVAIQTEVFIDDLNLGHWLSVLTEERVTGTGDLYGRLPITYRPGAEHPLKFGQGFLYAKPDGGTMQLRDAQQVGDLLERADPRYAKGGSLYNVRQRTTQALSDYAYDRFRFEIKDEGGSRSLRVFTSGQGRTGEKTPIGGIDLNITGFEDAANAYLFTKLSLDRALDRTLERVFE